MISIAASALLIWVFAHFLSPEGSTISWGQSFGAVFLMTIITVVAHYFGQPIVGYYWVPICTTVCILVIKFMLDLSYGRAMVLYLLYLGFWVGIDFVLSHYANVRTH